MQPDMDEYGHVHECEEASENDESIEVVHTEDIPRQTTEFDYEVFLRRMRHPSCRPLIVQVKGFITRFQQQASNGASSAQLVHQFRDFIDRLMEAVRENAVWRLTGDANPEEYEVAREGLEYLLTNQLYSVAFSPIEDRDRDELVGRKILSFGDWIRPSHLDISAKIMTDEEACEDAVLEFRKVNEYLTPRDKLVCLLNGCRTIQSLVEVNHPDASADEIMPVLIFVLLKAKIAQINSNLQYISRYRDPKELANEKAYHFTSLLAAASFIERMDQASLIISEEEYDARMEDAIMKINENSIHAEEDERLARKFAALASTERPHSPPASRRPSLSPEIKFKEEATKVFENVKEKLKLGASKSIDYLGKLMDEAEVSLGRAMNSGGTSPIQSPATDEQVKRAMHDEDEFQLQLAMALSISEQEFMQKSKESSQSEPGGEPLLVDVQDSDGKSCNAELS